jgi:hypothetical protein
MSPNIFVPEVEMGVVRSARSLDLIRDARNQNGKAKLVLTSFQLRQSQKDLIESLAEQSGESQATIVRAIFDEWCEMKLREQ